MSQPADRISAAFESLFRAEGLRFLGVVDLDVREDFERFRAWREEGRHGEMVFLEQHDALRGDPGRLLEGARNAVVFALPYDFGDTMPSPDEPPRIAQYARFADYHRLLRRRAERVADRVRELHAPGARTRVMVDTAPVLERALAAKTARGFIGKNTCYIHPLLGSFLMLGVVLTDIPLPSDERVPVDPARHLPSGGCGACRECQVHCPTGALDADYRIDAKKCLAYWTIEHRGVIPERFWPWIGTYYFGCDICQITCPYNMKDRHAKLAADIPRREYPDLFTVATMDQAAYERHFGGTPLTRAKRNGLRRNALIAMTVREDARLDEAIDLCGEDVGSPVAETLAQIERWRGGKTAPPSQVSISDIR